jgi:hypothetical protein
MQKPFVKEVVYQKMMINKLKKNSKAAALFILDFQWGIAYSRYCIS